MGRPIGRWRTKLARIRRIATGEISPNVNGCTSRRSETTGVTLFLPPGVSLRVIAQNKFGAVPFNFSSRSAVTCGGVESGGGVVVEPATTDMMRHERRSRKTTKRRTAPSKRRVACESATTRRGARQGGAPPATAQSAGRTGLKLSRLIFPEIPDDCAYHSPCRCVTVPLANRRPSSDRTRDFNPPTPPPFSPRERPID